VSKLYIFITDVYKFIQKMFMGLTSMQVYNVRLIAALCNIYFCTDRLTCWFIMQAVPEEDWFCPNCQCAICGGPPVNANPDEFNEMAVLSCDQCERGCKFEA
jgi:hypothetical protein